MSIGVRSRRCRSEGVAGEPEDSGERPPTAQAARQSSRRQKRPKSLDQRRLGTRLAARHFTQPMVDVESTLRGEANHQVCAFRRPAHAQHAIAASKQSLGNGMEYLIEQVVSHSR